MSRNRSQFSPYRNQDEALITCVILLSIGVMAAMVEQRRAGL